VGLFATHDEITNLVLPSNQSSEFTSLDQEVTTGVLRYRRDVGGRSVLGALVTARAGDDYHNRVYGVDGNLWLSSTNVVRFQFLGSQTHYPTAFAVENGQRSDAFHGYNGDLVYVHPARDWAWWGWWVNRDPGFRADAGFVSRIDLQSYGGGLQRTWWGEPEDFLNRLSFEVEAEQITDHGGRTTNQMLSVRGFCEGPWQSIFEPRVQFDREYYDGVTYDLSHGRFFFNTRPSGDFTCSLGGFFGQAIDYENSRLGKKMRLSPGFTLDLMRHLHLQMDGIFERFWVGDQRLYDAQLHQARLVYQINVRTFARVVLQYLDVEHNSALYLEEVDPRERGLFSQFLFSYKVNPQTVCFLGYSDNWGGTEEYGLAQSDRTLFFKLGYAWVQ
jgi:hypothetical protein